MAAQRYSKILQAARYYAAIDNYIQYITDATKRGQNVGNGSPRVASIKLYVRPFTEDLPIGQMVETSGAAPTWAARSAQFGTHTDPTAPTGEGLLIKLKGFSAARAIITTGRSATGIAKTSKVTGMKYLSYGGTSTSVPFGAKNDTETEASAAGEIEALILPTLGANDSVKFQPEKYSI